MFNKRAIKAIKKVIILAKRLLANRLSDLYIALDIVKGWLLVGNSAGPVN